MTRPIFASEIMPDQMRIMVPVFLFVLAASLQAQPTPTTPPPSLAKSYPVRGVVQAVATDRHQATIKHQTIPGYMAGMTMEFTAHDTNVLNGITPGDEITFRLTVTETNDWIDEVLVMGKTTLTGVSGPPGWHASEPDLSVGEALPDYEFTDENGRSDRFSDFRGSAVAFTFFYTSCPLPEYCPRMNRNFLEARRLLLADTNAPANWEFLSISFDPGFDTPQILAGYAKYYRGEYTNKWLFMSASTNTLASLAPKVDLSFWRENGAISHNLRTVVLDPHGKIAAQLDGNDWTPKELADAIAAAARK